MPNTRSNAPAYRLLLSACHDFTGCATGWNSGNFVPTITRLAFINLQIRYALCRMASRFATTFGRWRRGWCFCTPYAGWPRCSLPHSRIKRGFISGVQCLPSLAPLPSACGSCRAVGGNAGGAVGTVVVPCACSGSPVTSTAMPPNGRWRCFLHAVDTVVAPERSPANFWISLPSVPVCSRLFPVCSQSWKNKQDGNGL